MRLPVLLALLMASSAVSAMPRPDHILVVIEENRSYAEAMNKYRGETYIGELAKQGTLFTQSYAVSHPSQPNYLALFSGSTQDVVDDDCPMKFDGDNLAASLASRGYSFASYSETLPESGSTRCSFGPYQRKHNPAANWPSLSQTLINLSFEDFPSDFAKLPIVSFVIPDQRNDMHDGSFSQADEWLRVHIKPYVEWAYQNNSLLILTWDEDDGSDNNHIATILVGPMVKSGTSHQRINHYSVLRTLLETYDIPAIGRSRNAQSIRDIWKKP